MTSPTEKAAPIPALLPCPFCGGSVRMRQKSGTKGSTPGTRSRFYREHVRCETCGASGPEGKAPNASVAKWDRVARAVMQDRADREARPSLPDSREERIREDERDRLYEAALRDRDVAQVARTPLAYRMASDTVSWLLGKSAMLPADRARARQGGNNG